MKKSFLPAVTIAALMLMAAPTSAQIVPDKASLSDLYTGKAYSPYAHRTFPERPLWGDSHLHTVLSMDAGLIGNRLPPRDAYRFARGEEVLASSGQRVRLSRPLDWLVIADHSDGMEVGVAPASFTSAPSSTMAQAARLGMTVKSWSSLTNRAMNMRSLASLATSTSSSITLSRIPRFSCR